MCAQCKKTHAKIRTSKDHDVTPLTLKLEHIKYGVAQQATPARQRAITMTSHVAQLQQALEKLDVIHAVKEGSTEPDKRDPDIYKFSRLRKKRFAQQKDKDACLAKLPQSALVNSPQSVHSINDDIWTCQDDGTVQIFDQNLHCRRTLSDEQWGHVYDVTQLPNEDVVLAGLGGLYHLTANGETKTAIDKLDKYNSSVVVDDKLFANCYGPPRLIVYTMRNDRWETRDTISLAGVVGENAFVTMATANGKIFACSHLDNKVFVLSQSGEVLQTHGKEGPGPVGELMFHCLAVSKARSVPAGELSRPRLCAVDSEESMLVADRGNDRLQVCDVSGQWSVLDLQPPVKRPVRAAVIDNKLYVVCSSAERTLLVYVSE